LWDSLRIANNKLASVQLLVGQAWHPLVTGVPTMCSFETGVPFDNNNRSPQLTMTATFDNKFMLTAALVTQMQYTSNGPEGASVNYMKYACTPEAFLAFTYKNKGFKAEVGADLLSIKPRHRGYNSDSVMVKVSDRITTVSPFLHLEYNYKLFTVMARTQYSSAGEHINVMSGYAVSQKFDDGHWEYTPLHCSSSWLSLCLGKTYQGALFLGYIKNFGTNVSVTDIKDVYLSANTFVNMNQMYRIIPTFMYNLKKFTIGVEYDYTAVQYGDKKSFDKNDALCKGNLHWVDNHRFVCMVKYNF